jgi:copper homeostasis protein
VAEAAALAVEVHLEEVPVEVGSQQTIALEICIDSFTSAKAALDGGADRLEVCSALSAGGTTPSHGLIEQCINDLDLPCMVMIRPHDGGFVYDADDVEIMSSNIAAAKKLNADGVVFGALSCEGQIDLEICRRLLDAAAGMQTTFHRAFDLVSEPLKTFDQLQELGFDHVLTSGQQTKAIDGAKLIAELTKRSSVTSVLAGSGVSSENAAQLVRETGVREIHASASIPWPTKTSATTVSFGENRRVTCTEKVKAIRQQLLSL